MLGNAANQQLLQRARTLLADYDQVALQLLFLLGNDESRHTTGRAINFVKQRTDNVIVIDYAEISQGLHPWLAPFLMFVPMEWLCYYLSIYKDHNPDERRYYGGLVEY